TISLDLVNGDEINFVELLTAADELTLTDLVDYMQEHIINMDRNWFQQNIVQVFNTVSIPKFVLDSNILDRKHTALICSWIDRKEDTAIYLPNENPYNLKLLLRGTRDGFLVEDFRKRCFNQGPTLIVIQTSSSKSGKAIIGGYNSSSWTGSNKFTHSAESFIFSLRNDSHSYISTLSRIVTENDAISDDDSHFIGFGHGDLYIFKGSCQKKDYMYGILDKNKFSMDELEVFQVVKDLETLQIP
ncbi:1087_t:CDS:2, partial [Diversispora eburnea]